MEKPNLQSESEVAFASAKDISPESYNEMARGSGMIFEPIPEGFQIRMDQVYWYFRHDACQNIIKTFAENSPKQIAQMLVKHKGQCPKTSK